MLMARLETWTKAVGVVLLKCADCTRIGWHLQASLMTWYSVLPQGHH